MRALYFAAFTLSSTTASAPGQCYFGEISGAQASGDLFGWAVAMDEDEVIIGAMRDSQASFWAGAASVYSYAPNTGWSLDQKLIGSDTGNSDSFGHSVDIDGDYLIVGADRNDDQGVDSGSAYIYTRSPVNGSWIQEVKLLPNDGGSRDHFGYSVAIENDVAVIGAHSLFEAKPGAAYVFRKTAGAWSQEAKLVPGGAIPGDHVGISVSVSGTRVVVGSHESSISGTDSGSAHVFRYDDGIGWTEEATLEPSDAGPGKFFGVSVSIDGEQIAVGSQMAMEFDGDSWIEGAAYVFTWNAVTSGWIEEGKLTGGADPAEVFGYSVAIRGDHAVAGAFRRSGAAPSTGATYLFRRQGESWASGLPLFEPTGRTDDRFGWAVTMSDEWLVAGATTSDATIVDGGVVHAFQLAGDDCNENGKCDAYDIAVGDSRDINGDGVPDECCPGDLDGSGDVAFPDLVILLSQWGDCPALCFGDLTGDGITAFDDLVLLLSNWGPCP